MKIRPVIAEILLLLSLLLLVMMMLLFFILEQRWNIARAPQACSRKKLGRLRKDLRNSLQIYAPLKKCGRNVSNDLHCGLLHLKVKIILLNLRKVPFDIFHNVVSTM